MQRAQSSTYDFVLIQIFLINIKIDELSPLKEMKNSVKLLQSKKQAFVVSCWRLLSDTIISNWFLSEFWQTHFCLLRAYSKSGFALL